MLKLKEVAQERDEIDKLLSFELNEAFYAGEEDWL